MLKSSSAQITRKALSSCQSAGSWNEHSHGWDDADVAVPVAIAGFATPLIAAAAMSGSSILVTLNALRARRSSKQQLVSDAAAVSDQFAAESVS